MKVHLVLISSCVLINGMCCCVCHGQSVNDERREDVRSKFANKLKERNILNADGIMRRHDSNEDGILQPAEIKKMRKSLQDADVDRDGQISREELIAKFNSMTMKAMSSTLAFQMSGKLPENQSVKDPENPTIHFNLLQVDNGKPNEELTSLVKQFVEFPDKPGKLATKIKNLDNVFLVNASQIKPPLGQYVEVQTRDPIAGSFTRVRTFVRKHREVYSVWIELGTQRSGNLEETGQRKNSKVKTPQFFEHTFQFRQGSGSANFNTRGTGDTILGLVWEEKSED